VPRFLPVPVDGRKVSCHDETSKRYQVPISGRVVSCHDEIVQMTSKKQGTSASAGSPIDFVSAAGSVWVSQDLISVLMFTRIDFGGRLQSSLGCRSQLIKPSVLANVWNFRFVVRIVMVLKSPGR
jgi:hypothetical protein